MRVIVDTSTILAHLFSRGKNHTVEIFEMARRKDLALITSNETLLELKKTLASEKIKRLPNYRPYINAAFVAWYQYNSQLHVITSMPDIRIRDPSDNFFTQLAKVSQADFIISGDKDLLVLKSIDKTTIVKPHEFIEYLQK